MNQLMFLFKFLITIFKITNNFSFIKINTNFVELYCFLKYFIEIIELFEMKTIKTFKTLQISNNE